MAAYTGYLGSPAEQQFWADVLLLSSDVVEGAAVLHQLSHEHQLRRHADRRDTNTTRMVDGRHDARLLQQVAVLVGRRALA